MISAEICTQAKTDSTGFHPLAILTHSNKASFNAVKALFVQADRDRELLPTHSPLSLSLSLVICICWPSVLSLICV